MNVQTNKEQKLKWACYQTIHNYTDADIKRIRSKPYMLVRPHSTLNPAYIDKYYIRAIADFNIINPTTGTVVDNIEDYTHIALLTPPSEEQIEEVKEYICSTSSIIVPQSYTAFRTLLKQHNIRYTYKRCQMVLLKTLLDSTDQFKGKYWGDEKAHNWYVFTIRDAPTSFIFNPETTRAMDEHTIVTAIRITDTKAHNSKYYKMMRRNEAEKDHCYNKAVQFILHPEIYVEENNLSAEDGKEALRCYIEAMFNVFLDDNDIDDEIVAYLRRVVTCDDITARLNGWPVDGITLRSAVLYDEALQKRILYGIATTKAAPLHRYNK